MTLPALFSPVWKCPKQCGHSTVIIFSSSGINEGLNWTAGCSSSALASTVRFDGVGEGKRIFWPHLKQNPFVPISSGVTSIEFEQLGQVNRIPIPQGELGAKVVIDHRGRRGDARGHERDGG
jgi:hypothetical protein